MSSDSETLVHMPSPIQPNYTSLVACNTVGPSYSVPNVRYGTILDDALRVSMFMLEMYTFATFYAHDMQKITK